MCLSWMAWALLVLMTVVWSPGLVLATTPRYSELRCLRVKRQEIGCVVHMRKSSSLSVSALVFVWVLPAASAQDAEGRDSELPWFENFVAAEFEARQSGRPIFVYAYDTV